MTNPAPGEHRPDPRRHHPLAAAAGEFDKRVTEYLADDNAVSPVRQSYTGSSAASWARSCASSESSSEPGNGRAPGPGRVRAGDG